MQKVLLFCGSSGETTGELSFDNRLYLLQHDKPKHRCDDCGMRFRWWNSVLRHWKAVHDLYAEDDTGENENISENTEPVKEEQHPAEENILVYFPNETCSSAENQEWPGLSVSDNGEFRYGAKSVS